NERRRLTAGLHGREDLVRASQIGSRAEPLERLPCGPGLDARRVRVTRPGEGIGQQETGGGSFVWSLDRCREVYRPPEMARPGHWIPLGDLDGTQRRGGGRAEAVGPVLPCELLDLVRSTARGGNVARRQRDLDLRLEER